MNDRLCVVCDERPAIGVCLCRQCGRSYDTSSNCDGGSISDVIEWAAKRARYFERRRARKAERGSL